MIVRTARLLLREFVADDWRAVLAYQSDPRYHRFYPDSARSEAEARAFVQRFCDWQVERPRRRFQLAITRQGSPALIGNCGLRVVDPERRLAELGYELDPVWWGQGYATEAARAMLALGFDQLGLARIEAECLAANIRSVRVLEKLGLHRLDGCDEVVSFKGQSWQQWRCAIELDAWRALPVVAVCWSDDVSAREYPGLAYMSHPHHSVILR